MTRRIPPKRKAVPLPVVKCDIDRIYRNTTKHCDCFGCLLSNLGVDVFTCLRLPETDQKDPPKQP